MDHVKFFGLEREPLQNDLDGHFYFEGSSQRRARLHLMRALAQRKGLSLVLGGPGLGKSTLAHQLLRDLEPGKFAAHLLLSSHRECARGWLLPQLARVWGVPKPAARIPELIDQIHERLLAVRLAGRQPVLFVDEAQLLGEPQTLEEFRALLNFSHDGQRVFSIVLFGMEELGGVLALDPSLAQRVDVRVELCAFSPEEAAAYLAHRLERAGGSPDLFAPEALDALYLYSGGVLRVLNTLADNALFETALEECTQVGADHVAAAARQLDLRPCVAESACRPAASFRAAVARVAASPEPPAARLESQPSTKLEPQPQPQPQPRLETQPAASPAPQLPLQSAPLAFGPAAPVAAPIVPETWAPPAAPASAASTSVPESADEDWLEPVAPVLDEVMKNFATPGPESGPAGNEDPQSASNREAGAADADDPLGWSLFDLPAESQARELPPAAQDASALAGHAQSEADEAGEDSMADLVFGNGPAAVVDAAEPAEIDPADDDSLDELLLEHEAKSVPQLPAVPERKGPRIDLPEDDDLDSLFDDIQIES